MHQLSYPGSLSMFILLQNIFSQKPVPIWIIIVVINKLVLYSWFALVFFVSAEGKKGQQVIFLLLDLKIHGMGWDVVIHLFVQKY